MIDTSPESLEEREEWARLESRIDVVGQNGNDGLHYSADEPARAPEGRWPVSKPLKNRLLAICWLLLGIYSIIAVHVGAGWGLAFLAAYSGFMLGRVVADIANEGAADD